MVFLVKKIWVAIWFWLCGIVVTTYVQKTTYVPTLCVFNTHDEELGFCFLVTPLCSMVACMVLIIDYLCHLILHNKSRMLGIGFPINTILCWALFLITLLSCESFESLNFVKHESFSSFKILKNLLTKWPIKIVCLIIREDHMYMCA